MKYVIWKYVYNEEGEMEKVYYNGTGWSRRSSAQRMSESEARSKQARLPGSMIRVISRS